MRDAAARHAAADPLDPADVAADLELVAAVALDVEEVVERHCRLPRTTGSARISSCDSAAITSGREHLRLQRDVRAVP